MTRSVVYRSLARVIAKVNYRPTIGFANRVARLFSRILFFSLESYISLFNF